MPDKTELQEYIALCDCKEIQSIYNSSYVFVCSKCHKTLFKSQGCLCSGDTSNICLPAIDQLLERLGDKFNELTLVDYMFEEAYWKCEVDIKRKNCFNKFVIEQMRFEGQSARIALVKAVKEVLND